MTNLDLGSCSSRWVAPAKVKSIVLAVAITMIFGQSVFGQFCDETSSYNEKWLKQARKREAGREDREKYYKTLTAEQLASISDSEFYPTMLMTCGMGFSEKLAKVRVDGKVGFIDNSGTLVVKPQFSDSGRYSEGLAPVEFSDGKWGYIDKNGSIVIKPSFDWALIFREGLALVQIGKKWGFIDKAGILRIPATFDHANSFAEGLAHVQIYRDKYFSGYIDKTGKWVIEPVFNGGEDFVNGKTIADLDVLDENGRYKYTTSYKIDRKGTKLEEVEGSREVKGLRPLGSSGVSLIFDHHKTGYANRRGRVIWKPTN